MEREPFLARVRDALRGAGVRELPRSFPATPASADGSASPDRFVSELAKTGGMARVVPMTALPDAVADVVHELPAGRRTVVSPDTGDFQEAIHRGLRAALAEVVTPATPAEWREEAASADLGVSSATLGIASTGSVLIVPGPDSPRVVSLLPEAHLVVLPAGRVVPGFEDAMATLGSLVSSSSAPVIVTGPSRTSDIEMTTVLGVHGPRILRVLLVE